MQRAEAVDRNLHSEDRSSHGVITKPDLIDPGAEDDVKRLLIGEKTNTFKLAETGARAYVCTELISCWKVQGTEKALEGFKAILSGRVLYIHSIPFPICSTSIKLVKMCKAVENKNLTKNVSIEYSTITMRRILIN